jgi:cyclophilin family peptidyl-prolyl cis-trans isomerase
VGTAKRERQKANRQQRLEEMARQVSKTKRKRNVTKWVTLGVVGVVVVILIAVLSGGDSTDDAAGTDTGTTTSTAEGAGITAGTTTTLALPTTPGLTVTGDTPCPNADGSSQRTTVFAKEPPMCIDAAKTYTAVVETNKGSYTVALDAANAPKTVNNFVVLARYHYFDNTVCHRIIQGFMAQCGDPSGSGNGDGGKYPGYEFANENEPAEASYAKGTLAMANAGKDTNGSQFFTMLADYPLPADYSVFGKVTDGLDTTLAAIEAAADPAAPNGVPTKEQVVIQSVTITES